MQSVDFPEFKPHPWLANEHLQTVYASLLMPIRNPGYRRELLTTPDGDVIAADWIDGPEDQPMLVLIHGMEGDSDSRYARLLMTECRNRSWRGVVLHMRSCGGLMNRKQTFYHAGYYEDIQFFMDQVLPKRSLMSKPFLMGVSLGGSQVLHYLAKGKAKENVRAGAVVSTPLDLRGSADFMIGGLNRIYVLKFRNSLVKKYKMKSHLIDNPQIVIDLAKAKNFWDLDNIATAPMHGFRDANHYYDEMSSKNVLKDIQVPTVYLAAKDDPFIPEESMPETGYHFDNLQAYLTEAGGHVGFIDNQHESWMVKAVFKYFTTIESKNS